MKLFKTVLLIAATAALLGIISVLILLKFPVTDPELPSQKFAPRPVSENQIKVTVLETGYSDAPESFVSRQGSLFKKMRLPHVAVLVEHPKATFVIDAGLGSTVDQEIGRGPWLVRAMPYASTLPLIKNPAILRLKGKIDFFLITHLHWDHVSGLLDFPHVPAHMLTEEAAFGNSKEASEHHGVFPHHMEKIQSRIVPLRLNDVPYENFSRSLDLFSDGSVVIVSLEGHTPGSLGVFINKAPDKRLFFVGDAVWTLDGEGKPEARSFLAELISDLDRTQARIIRKKLEALVDHSKEITLLPTHEPNFQEIVRSVQ
jgi:glyoxylase-like metal-dependent hydrolase (beta-lactamase superfamily II)